RGRAAGAPVAHPGRPHAGGGLHLADDAVRRGLARRCVAGSGRSTRGRRGRGPRRHGDGARGVRRGPHRDLPMGAPRGCDPATARPDRVRIVTGRPRARTGPPVGLSTSSVFPEGTERAFALAAELGYDGVELMVTADRSTQEADRLRALVDRYGVPVV